jgi:hypothetical protein
VSEVSADGGIVTLEDESVWQVSSLDRIDSTLWLPTENIVVLENPKGLEPYLLINEDTGDTVEAKLLSE